MFRNFRTIFFFALSLLIITPMISQEKERPRDESKEKSSRFEIGLNATTVLSSFIGNQSLVEASDFPIMLRVGFKRFALRSAFGIDGSSKEFFDSVSGIFRINDIKEYFFKAGFEVEFFRENKWSAYTGIDAIYSQVNDKVTVQSFDQVIISNDIMQFGAGPILGIKYWANKRLYFSSEATLYGFVKRSKIVQEENSVSATISESTDYSGSLQSPLALYINYKL